MVAVNTVKESAEQVFMFPYLFGKSVPKPEVTYIRRKGSGRRQWPDVFGPLFELAPECGKLGLESG